MSDDCVLTMEEAGSEGKTMKHYSVAAAVAFVQRTLDVMNKNGDYNVTFSAKITRNADGEVYIVPIYKTRMSDGWLYTLAPVMCEGVAVSTPMGVSR